MEGGNGYVGYLEVDTYLWMFRRHIYAYIKIKCLFQINQMKEVLQCMHAQNK